MAGCSGSWRGYPSSAPIEPLVSSLVSLSAIISAPESFGLLLGEGWPHCPSASPSRRWGARSAAAPPSTPKPVDTPPDVEGRQQRSSCQVSWATRSPIDRIPGIPVSLRSKSLAGAKTSFRSFGGGLT
jgi:hypothetical protein